ncbi:MAG: dihydroneopterin aldolase [Bacteroidales bacterium]|nr:dihydroneopterin aldolase [Bacteroidales bacterium]
MKGTIELKGLQFKAFHGCLPREKRRGNRFLADVRFEYVITDAAESDELADAVDYSRIYEIVAGEMAQPSNLLENVAGRILVAIEAAYPELENIEVTVSKKNPPLGGRCEWARVTAKK